MKNKQLVGLGWFISLIASVMLGGCISTQKNNLGRNQSSPIERPFERAAQEYYLKLVNARYDELEIEAEQYRAGNELLSDGQPRLSALYGGIGGCADQGCTYDATPEQWKLRFERLSEWGQKNPESVTAKIGLAKYYIEYGWYFRGIGYSNTVSEESRQAFRKNVEEGRMQLDGFDSKIKEDAGWFEAMLEVGLAQGWGPEKFDRIFTEGVRIHPYYFPLYFLKGAYLAPRWYGSVDQVRKFVDESLSITRPKLGETMYARINWSSWSREMFRDGQANWQRMRGGFEELISEYPDSWNINNYAKFACIAGDYETLDTLLRRIGGAPLKAAWGNDLDYYARCTSWAHNIIHQKITTNRPAESVDRYRAQ